jgi:hypothetical protein
MHRAAAVIVFAVLAATPFAVASSQTTKSVVATSAGAIKAGTYDLQIVAGGGTLDGTLVLTAKGDSITAALHVGDHEPPIRNLTRKGTRLFVAAGGEGMQASYDLNFDGDALSGTFTFNGNPGIVTGKLRTGASR